MKDFNFELKEVKHLARLARLKFSPSEEEQFLKDLNEILKYISKIQEVDTEKIEPLTYFESQKNVFREDEERKIDYDRKLLLANAPFYDHHTGHFKVHPVFRK
jgi:aspartyl-tRNA(Asn)/glutamyl-tRNA(Gln) amidotransferase subunit C